MTFSAFGIEFGSQPPTGFTEVAAGVFSGDCPPRPHSSFSQYMVVSGNNVGVAKIVGLSLPFDNDAYGGNIRAAFSELKAQLIRKYGRSKDFDFPKVGSIWTEPRDWSMGIIMNERTYLTLWNAENGSSMPEGAEVIILQVCSGVGSSLRIKLTYESTNINDALEEIKSAEADVL